MSVEDSEKDSGTVISEHRCLPKLNLSRMDIDAESRIGLRFVGEAGFEESEDIVELFSQPSSIIVPPSPNTARLAH